jgi:hypothetical protein
VISGPGGKKRVFVDGKLGPEHDDIGGPILSPNGDRFAYAARTTSKWQMVVDGVPGPQYDGILGGSPAFSADDRRVAYVGNAGNKYVAVVDGTAGREYDGIGTSGLRFSAFVRVRHPRRRP